MLRMLLPRMTSIVHESSRARIAHRLTRPILGVPVVVFMSASPLPGRWWPVLVASPIDRVVSHGCRAIGCV
jgi:hypothetical protein